jgi:membrane-bound lytic murein transglycosylase D
LIFALDGRYGPFKRLEISNLTSKGMGNTIKRVSKIGIKSRLIKVPCRPWINQSVSWTISISALLVLLAACSPKSPERVGTLVPSSPLESQTQRPAANSPAPTPGAEATLEQEREAQYYTYSVTERPGEASDRIKSNQMKDDESVELSADEEELLARLVPESSIKEREEPLRKREPSIQSPKMGEESEGDTRFKKEAGPEIPMVLNKKVEWFIRYFTGVNRSVFARWLERSTRYRDMMIEILQEEGVPEDLIYIALIESGFNPKAYSWAGASGPWQFMRATGRKYGLKVNWWIDERRDPVKSTRAAARYFKFLHRTFQSWYLAQAGYNAGEGRIRRGLKRLKKKDFWTLARTRYIARETRNFVPKFVAAAMIAKNPEVYGFDSLNYQDPLRFEEVPVPRSTSLHRIAAAAGISVRDLKRLNPSLRRLKTPPNYKAYRIKVPVGTSVKVAAAIRNWKPELYAGGKYRVQSGDTLGEIARNLGTTVDALTELNGLRDPGRIYLGQKLHVPGKGKGLKRKHSASPSRVIHVVRRGDTLWDISREYGMSVEKILSVNGLPKGARIRPGEKIRLVP